MYGIHIRYMVTILLCSSYMSSYDKLVLIEATCEKYNDTFWNVVKQHTCINYSIGNFILIDNQIYILTCYHGIDNFITINIILQDKKYQVTYKAGFPEYDLALLKPDHINDIDIIGYYEITDINLVIHECECTLSSYKLDLDVFHKKIKATSIFYEISCNSFDIESPVSHSSPKMIYVSFPCETLISKDNIDISGLSGSLLTEKQSNSIIGMIVSNIDGKIMALHSSMIYRFLSEYRDTQNVYGICDIPLKYKLHRGTVTNGLIINDAYNIQYKKNTTSNVYEPLDTHTFEKNDIIIALNGQKIDENGNIFCPNIQIQIPISTYIALNFYKDQKLTIAFIRKKKLEQIAISARLFDTMVKIPYNTNREYISFCGFIFTELTESILINYNLILDTMKGDFIDIYQHNNYTNDNIRIIILVDIDKSYTDNNEKKLDEINSLGLPIIYNEDNYSHSVPVLKKINDELVHNFDDLKSLLKMSSSQKSTKFNFKSTKTFNITFEHDNL